MGQKDYSSVTVTLPLCPKPVSALSHINTGSLGHSGKLVFQPVFSFCATGSSTIHIYHDLCFVNELTLVYVCCFNS